MNATLLDVVYGACLTVIIWSLICIRKKDGWK